MSLVFGDDIFAQCLHLKSHQRCSAGPYTQRHCHDRIEKGPVQTVDYKNGNTFGNIVGICG